MTFYTMPLTDLDGSFTRNWDYYAKDPFGELKSTSGVFFEDLYSSLERAIDQLSSSKTRSI